jgi:predicted MPP superfamily phosphohydrolase
MKLPSKKRLIYGFLVLFVLICGLAVWALIIEPSRLVVSNYKLELKNWSPRLNGFKIVAIADIHGGSNFVTEARIREVVRLANEQNADLIVLLGDYVAHQSFDRTKILMPLETVMNNLKGLKAKFGVLAVIGNHDNEVGNELVRAELERIGYKVLENEAVSIEKNGENLRIVGAPDTLRQNNPVIYSDDVKNALAKTGSKNSKIIALSHNPDALLNLTGDYLISPDFTLFIGGHTHGGQCRFPIIGAPVVPTLFGQKYAAGHIRDLGVDTFISSGIGMSYLPVRFGVPPEISVLELYQEN